MTPLPSSPLSEPPRGPESRAAGQGRARPGCAAAPARVRPGCGAAAGNAFFVLVQSIGAALYAAIFGDSHAPSVVEAGGIAWRGVRHDCNTAGGFQFGALPMNPRGAP